MNVTIESIREMVKFRRKINSISLDEIELYENGERLKVSVKEIDKWELTGLNNIDFITSHFVMP